MKHAIITVFNIKISDKTLLPIELQINLVAYVQNKHFNFTFGPILCLAWQSNLEICLRIFLSIFQHPPLFCCKRISCTPVSK